ncbi:MAG TPA: LysR substrate-binding domain-containing protein [Polyangiaceae bacterium]
MRSPAVSIARVDLNLMLVLHTVLAERNVARAAERLHVTPSAVSNALGRLRDLFGDPLVTRKGRGIVPTPRAMDLAPSIARAIHELELTLLATPFEPSSCTRSFTLAVADVGQVIWVPRLAKAMRRELPLAHLRVVGIDGLISLGDLNSSEVDLQLGVPWKAPGIHVERLVLEQSALVARRAHPVFARRVTNKSLGGLQHVRVDMVPGKPFGDPFASAFTRAGVERAVVVTVPSFIAAAEVVAASDLVTVLPTSLFNAKARGLGLRAIDAAPPMRAIEIAMCWHERTHNDPAARAFRELVKRIALGSTPAGE